MLNECARVDTRAHLPFSAVFKAFLVLGRRHTGELFEKIGKELGQTALSNFHGHVAGIQYNDKGEIRHLVFNESDFNYKDLLKAMKKFNIKGALVCESPNIEIDTKILKDYYESL